MSPTAGRHRAARRPVRVLLAAGVGLLLLLIPAGCGPQKLSAREARRFSSFLRRHVPDGYAIMRTSRSPADPASATETRPAEADPPVSTDEDQPLYGWEISRAGDRPLLTLRLTPLETWGETVSLFAWNDWIVQVNTKPAGTSADELIDSLIVSAIRDDEVRTLKEVERDIDRERSTWTFGVGFGYGVHPYHYGHGYRHWHGHP
ncbi:MAG: hypothetical protein ACLFVU_05675 [Phycisphaerae bacterium]